MIVPGPGGKKNILFPKITQQVLFLYASGYERLANGKISGREVGNGDIILNGERSKELTDIFRRIVRVSCGDAAWENMVEASNGVTVPGVEFFCRLFPWVKLFSKLYDWK